MREIKFITWCDACPDEDRVEADSFTIGVAVGSNDRPALHTLDLCEMHTKGLLGPLQVLLAKAAPFRPNDRQSDTAGGRPKQGVHELPMANDIACEICGLLMRRTSIITHVWAVHRKGETRQPIGTTCTACGATYQTGQALGQHRMRMHGYDPIAEAYAGARAAAAKPAKPTRSAGKPPKLPLVG